MSIFSKTKYNFIKTNPPGLMTVVPAAPSLRLDLEHFENLTRCVSALTIDPMKSFAYYLFPFLAAYSSSYIELRQNDLAQDAMMPDASKKIILKEVQELSQIANLQRSLTPYCALNHHFSSSGGSLSITTPALFLPYQHLFRAAKSHFGQERPEEQLEKETWVYSDNETRFLIARELMPIKENNALLRIAIKVSFLVAVFMIYSTPFGWITGTALLAGAIVLYLLSERLFEGKMDLFGIEILGKRLNDPQKAGQVALDTLEKMRRQNLIRREQSSISRLYITKSGNNILDFNHPFLTTRILRIQEHRKNELQPIPHLRTVVS